MKLLVRAPNWLGDAVMSLGFLGKLAEEFPGAEIHLIVKDTLAGLFEHVPAVTRVHAFTKSAQGGFRGARAFGRKIGAHGPFDVFFCLPDSFSSAFMGVFTGSRRRVGFRGQWRSFLLTDACRKPSGLHRAEEYAHLLSQHCGHDVGPLTIRLCADSDAGAALLPEKRPVIVLNPNSEAPSRRTSSEKWRAVARALHERMQGSLVVIGGPGDRSRAGEVAAAIAMPEAVTDLAGKTNLAQLASVLAAADLVVSVDSGPAHMANAVGTPTIVFFGAGNEANTAPCDKRNLRVLRAPGLACAPCSSNTCRSGYPPKCLEQIPAESVMEAATELLGGRLRRT